MLHGVLVNNQYRPIKIVVVAAVLASFLAGCQNRRTGIFGSDNWGRNGYANQFLTNPLNPNTLADGRAIGYVVYNQSSNGGFARQGANVPFNGNAGGVRNNNNPQGPNGNAGGVAGANGALSVQTPCMLKVASGSSQTLYSGSNQSFGNAYNESYLPSSGQPFYAIGLRQPITCGKDTEIAATAGAFYITSGSGGNNLWIYRFSNQGIPVGTSPNFAINAPTKVAASSSGHIVVISNNGKSLSLIYEGRVDPTGNWIPDTYHTIPATNNSTFTDVAIDRQQGAIYVSERLVGGGGRVQILPIGAAYNGMYNMGLSNSLMNTDALLNARTAYNFANNLPSETAMSFLFRDSSPLKVKNNNGLTGIFTTAGHPFFMVTELGLSQAETQNRTMQELNDIYASGAENMHVQKLDIFDPFLTSSNSNSPYTQPQSYQSRYRYKDFAVGKDLVYLISDQGTLSTMYASPDYTIDATTPWVTQLAVGRANTIEMSEDQKIAVVTGSIGLQIGRVAGNNLIFSSTGRPDISETGEVIHAAVLEKVYRPAQPNHNRNMGTNRTANNVQAVGTDTTSLLTE